ncbi:oligosaccharide flippase family protein [Pyxidicoccus fallax]|uniref:Oligosaccharide flippase family protein n=2 Tax=Pyxidicoccus fallax TaxID=394095 RepID=A0A848L6T6_9BACT|nr:exopolysaccharide biosynthesis flippase [Pyxidicoccus fallax]NMO13982.1 oligosaccharide flippase family protein [Pyxidicoccus fallax]NPC76686.1 oligosaccharide flippase family protein [Pyxidicoccus fallax]
MGAVRNGLQLGGSLLVTYAIAMGVRFLLPAHLGPERFGSFNWADSFSAVFFIATHLGLEMYIRKEVTRRPAHASDFFGTTLLLRLGLTVVLMGVLGLVMANDEHSSDVRNLVYVTAVAQSLIMVNASVAALLHAKGKVAGLSVSNIVTKLVWGGGLFVVAWAGLPLPWLGVPLVASEAVKLGVGWYLARVHMGLTFKVDLPATWKVLKASLPFFITGAALATNGRLDVMILGMKASHQEVGFYGAAWNIAGLTFFLNPVFGWVLMPLASRAAERSEEELTRLVRRAMEGTLVVTVPMMMLIVMGAPLWVGLMGDQFAPSTLSLRLLSPLFVLAFVTMNAGLWLTMTNREWWVTITNSTGSLLLSPILNLMLVPFMHRALGNGGGAAATATALLVMEVLVTISLMGRMGRAAFDSRLLSMVVRTAVVCLTIVVADQTLFAPLNPWVRLGLEAVLYVVGVLAIGAVRPGDVLQVLRLARRRGRPEPEAAAPAVAPVP